MRVSSATQNRHLRQEAEANAFAIELLTPRSRLTPLLGGPPHLEKVLKIAGEFDISREAAARRYVQLHGDCIAAVFTKDGRFGYAERGAEFPFIALRQGQECAAAGVAAGEISDVDEVDASDWLARERDVQLTAQTFGQAKGYAITLLCAALPDEEDESRDRRSLRALRPPGAPIDRRCAVAAILATFPDPMLKIPCSRWQGIRP